jgi:hypothetical protein
MLWAVTACAVLLAAMHWFQLSPLAVAGLLFLAISIFLHVVGNAIGTRLRELGDDPQIQRMDLEFPQLHAPRPDDFAPATRLGVRQSLGWTIIAATALGTVLGGIGGGTWTFLTSRGPVNLPNIGIGVIAFGALGGLAAFGVFALVQVLSGAIWQALSSPADRRSPGRDR